MELERLLQAQELKRAEAVANRLLALKPESPIRTEQVINLFPPVRV
ncbi:MAG: hypothetical protein KatS3mg115_1554 [Candidatus Poribacteria bacterium]|nr:MAG: hypothetical protein KatS3mg115_1554 [Candidatus Poribacteria bacterium]